MKKFSPVGILCAAVLPLAGGAAHADEVIARVKFNGTLKNRPSQQTIQGTFKGTGEYGRFDLDVDLNGSVRSQPGTRTPEKNVLGKYPVEINLRLSKSGVSVSDSFGANVHVRGKRIRVSDVGTLRLKRPVKRTKVGTQRLRAEGRLSYHF